MLKQAISIYNQTGQLNNEQIEKCLAATAEFFIASENSRLAPQLTDSIMTRLDEAREKLADLREKGLYVKYV